MPTGARLPVAQAAGDEVKKQIQAQHGLGRARRYRRDVAVACQRGQNEPKRGASDIAIHRKFQTRRVAEDSTQLYGEATQHSMRLSVDGYIYGEDNPGTGADAQRR